MGDHPPGAGAPHQPPRGPLVLRPMLATAGGLSSSARLIALAVVLVIPGLIATWSFASSIGSQIDFTRAELTGVRALAPVLDHLVASAAVAPGQPAPDTTALTGLAQRYPELQLDEAVAAVGATGDDTLARTAALVDLVTRVANTSNLILDPELDSFYLMDAQVVQLPRAVEAAAAGAHPQDGPLNERVAAQAVVAGGLKSAADALATDLATARENDSTGSGDVEELHTLGTAVAQLGDDLSAGVGSPAAGDAGAVLQAAGAAVAPATTALESKLRHRVDRLESRRDVALGVTALGLLLGLWLAAALWWRTRTDVGLAVSAVQAMAAGDLSDRPLPAGRDELGQIGLSVEAARVKLRTAADELVSITKAREDEMNSAFLQQRDTERQARERAQRLVSETSTVVVDDLQEVVGQVEAVRGTASTIDSKVANANDVTRSVVEQAAQADRVVVALGESLDQVAGMAQLIAGVADQTRLLALNATIEAARAGEAGHGFRVVAAEVKQLAMTTAESTGRIRQIITEIERDAGEMSTAIVAMSSRVAGLDEATAVLSGVAQEQRSRLEELDRAVGDAITRVRDMERLSETLERRENERVPVNTPARVRIGGQEHVATVLDVSSTGVACRVDGVLAQVTRVGEAVWLSFTDGATTFEADTQVSRKQALDGGAARLGLRLVDPDLTTQRALARVIERHSA